MPLIQSVSNDKCFWCKKLLSQSERTRDHFFSVFLRQNFIITNKNFYCISCRSCNHFRGELSALFIFIWCYKNSILNPKLKYIPTKKNIARMSKSLLKKNKDLLQFRNKITDVLKGEGQQVCLLEIDTVIDYLAALPI